MSKSTRDNNMNGGVAVCYCPLLVENEVLTFCLSSRDFWTGVGGGMHHTRTGHVT